MDTNGDLEIMSDVGHLRRTPEFVTGNGFGKVCFSDQHSDSFHTETREKQISRDLI